MLVCLFVAESLCFLSGTSYDDTTKSHKHKRYYSRQAPNLVYSLQCTLISDFVNSAPVDCGRTSVSCLDSLRCQRENERQSVRTFTYKKWFFS